MTRNEAYNMIITGKGFPTYPCWGCSEQDFSGVPCTCTKYQDYLEAKKKISPEMSKARQNYLNYLAGKEEIDELLKQMEDNVHSITSYLDTLPE